MNISLPAARSLALIAIASALAGCVSSGPYANPGRNSLDQRYNGAAAAPAPRYGHWSMNSYERSAERKAIEQDQPFSTVVPSRY